MASSPTPPWSWAPRVSITDEVPGVCVVFGARLLFPVAICAADAIAAGPTDKAKW